MGAAVADRQGRGAGVRLSAGGVYSERATAFKRRARRFHGVGPNNPGVEFLIRALEMLAGGIHFRPGLKKAVMPVSFIA